MSRRQRAGFPCFVAEKCGHQHGDQQAAENCGRSQIARTPWLHRVEIFKVSLPKTSDSPTQQLVSAVERDR